LLKRIAMLLGIAAIPLMIMAAAPTNLSQTQTTATATVDSQWTSTWFSLDSMIIVKDDSCDTYYHGTATVVLKPGQKLYYGLKDGAAGVADTHIIQLPYDADSNETIEIGVDYVDSLRSQTDANDSIQFVAAVAGGSDVERVTVTGIRLTGTVINFD
jgi:hypothetical protein